MHNILVLTAYAQMSLIKAYTDISSEANGLNFGMCLKLHPFMCMRADMAFVSLRICTDSPKPSLLADAISTENSGTCPYHGLFIFTLYFIISVMVSMSSNC